MSAAEYNFTLALVALAMNALWAIAWWFFRGYLSANKECLRHLEVGMNTLNANLEAWKLESTAAHFKLGNDCGLVSGKLDTLTTQSHDQAADIKSMMPRLSVAEFRLAQIGRKQDGNGS